MQKYCIYHVFANKCYFVFSRILFVFSLLSAHEGSKNKLKFKHNFWGNMILLNRFFILLLIHCIFHCFYEWRNLFFISRYLIFMPEYLMLKIETAKNRKWFCTKFLLRNNRLEIYKVIRHLLNNSRDTNIFILYTKMY